MKKNIRVIGIIILILVVLSAGFILLRPKPLPAQESINNLEELETYLDNLAGYNAASPSGISLVVIQDGEIVYENAFGMADGLQNIPATPNTVYNQWSVTKMFTATAILQLQEAGLLNIEDSVKKHLPFFDVEYPSANSETITIRHLLNHSSGLANNTPEIVGWVHTDGDPEWNQTELLRVKLPDYAKLNYEPGQHAIYTNVGYMVLTAVIEEVSGQAYEEYVVEHILTPLGMELTNFTYTEIMEAHEATGTHPRWDTINPLIPIFIDDFDALVREKSARIIWFNHIYSDQNGPTGLIGPPTDTARFLSAYMSGGELDGHRILSSESIETMTNDFHIIAGPSPESNEYDELYHGLGWYVVPNADGTFYLNHSGGGLGFSADMRLYPQRSLGMVIMANGTYLPKREIFDQLASLEW